MMVTHDERKPKKGKQYKIDESIVGCNVREPINDNKIDESREHIMKENQRSWW